MPQSRIMQTTVLRPKETANIMSYGLRLSDGRVEMLSESAPLTDELADAVIGGGAELVWLDEQGAARAVDPRPACRPSLSAIVIVHSEAPMFHVGYRFDTLADFDAAVRSARASTDCAQQCITLHIAWTDGTSLQTRFALSPEGDGCLFEHIYRICHDALASQASGLDAAKARLVLEHVFASGVAENLNSTDWHA
jgi:hypothetical protein